MCPKKHGRGSAPQEQSDWKKPVGGCTEISPLKLTTTAENALFFSLLALPSAFTCLLTDVDSRLTIRLQKPSKSIQHIVIVITTRNKQLPRPTKQPRPPMARGLPGDVAKQRLKPSEISVKHKGTTWDRKTRDLRPA